MTGVRFVIVCSKELTLPHGLSVDEGMHKAKLIVDSLWIKLTAEVFTEVTPVLTLFSILSMIPGGYLRKKWRISKNKVGAPFLKANWESFSSNASKTLC